MDEIDIGDKTAEDVFLNDQISIKLCDILFNKEYLPMYLHVRRTPVCNDRRRNRQKTNDYQNLG